MKTLILATLFVAPLTMADNCLPVRYMEDRIGISAESFVLLDKRGQEYHIKTDCDMDRVTTFKTKSRSIREGTVIRVAKDYTCRVESVTKTS